jgi:chromosome segregation ATPase
MSSAEPSGLPEAPLESRPDQLCHEPVPAERDALDGFVSEGPDDVRPPAPSGNGTSRPPRPDSAPVPHTPAAAARTDEIRVPAEGAVDLARLRDAGSRLARGYAALEAMSRQTESRNTQALARLDAIEGRVGPLEAVRELARDCDSRLEALRRLADEIAARAADFEGRKAGIDEGLAQLARMSETLADVGARADRVTGAQGLLQQAEIAVAQLQARVSDLVPDVERRVRDFEAQQALIRQALADAAQIRDLLAALEAQAAALEARTGTLDARVAAIDDRAAAVGGRVAALTGPDRVLARAEEEVGRLERLAADTAHTLERLADGFEAQTQGIARALAESARASALVSALEVRVAALAAPDAVLDRAGGTVGQLERRAAETIADLERRVAAFEAQTARLEQALGEAARAGDLVSTLDARVSALTGSGQVLGRADAAIAQLEERAAAASADLERRLQEADALKRTIDGASSESSQLSQFLSSLDARLARLAAPDQAADQAEVAVAAMERRAAGATGALARVVAAKDDVERALGSARQELAALAESARSEAKALASATRTGRRSRRNWGTFWISAVVLVPFLVVTALALAMLRSAGYPFGTLTIDVPDRRQQDRAAGAPVASAKPTADVTLPAVRALTDAAPSRPAMVPSSGRGGPAIPPPAAAAGRPGGSSPDRAAKTVAAAQRPGPSRPAAAGREGGRGDARPRPETPSASQATPPAADAPRFVGVLGIDSMPTGAAVFVDRQHVGETPLEMAQVRAGSHAIRITRDGHRPWTASVHVPAGKRTDVSIVLQPVEPPAR